MKHIINVTPMNAGFGLGMNGLVTFNQDEYVNAPQRMILLKDPDVSWFKFKSVTATAYTEPFFFGLGKGDLVTVEFEALKVSGEYASVSFDFVSIKDDYTTLNQVGKVLPTDSLQPFYKKFKMSAFIEHDGIGTVVNVRPAGSNNEIIIKNITIEIETNNPLFSLMDNVVRYDTKTDYLKMIHLYGGTNLNPTYNGLQKLMNEGKVLFPDGKTLQFKEAGITDFKGAMALFNGHKYRPTCAVYMEYQTPTASTITIKNVSDDGTLVQESAIGFPPSPNGFTKALRYLPGHVTPSRKTFLDVGFVSSGTDLSIRNVRLSMPQFDDSVKRAMPNQLDELYSNLATKLR